MQFTTGLRTMYYINKSGLIKGSEVFWLVLQSQIVIRLDDTGFNPVMHCYLHGTFASQNLFCNLNVHALDQSGSRQPTYTFHA